MTTDASSDLENEVDNQAQVVETNESEVQAESSPASEENHEEKSTGVEKRINKLTAEKYQYKRELEELKRKLDNPEVPTQKPEVIDQEVSPPTLPEDLYDEEAMRKYHADTIKYQQKVAQQAAKSLYTDQQTEAQKQAQAQQNKEVISKYASNAIRDGVDLDKLAGAEQAVLAANVKPEIAQFLMTDNNGAKIVEYLADNPAELYEIAQMDPIRAGIHLATKVKPKAISTTPKVSNAPEPIPNVTGGGTVETDDFDRNYPGAEII